MNRHMAVSLMLAAGGLCRAPRVSGQGKALDPTSLEVFNRTATSLTDGNRAGVRLSARADNGVAYLRGVELGNGTIELDIRGKDVQGQSFVGVAFHGVDDSTYDAVYLRPFNFKTGDPERHKHAVQYVSRGRDGAQSGGEPAESSCQGTGGVVGRERLRRGLRQSQDRAEGVTPDSASRG